MLPPKISRILPGSPSGKRQHEEAWAGKPQADFCEGQAHNGAGSNTVTLSKPKGESNGEHKADLHTGGVLSTRPATPGRSSAVLGFETYARNPRGQVERRSTRATGGIAHGSGAITPSPSTPWRDHIHGSRRGCCCLMSICKDCMAWGAQMPGPRWRPAAHPCYHADRPVSRERSLRGSGIRRLRPCRQAV
jgi:hypothetical protein